MKELTKAVNRLGQLNKERNKAITMQVNKWKDPMKKVIVYKRGTMAVLKILSKKMDLCLIQLEKLTNKQLVP